MQKLLIHLSALIGLVIFLKQAWTYAPLDRALMTAIGTGLGIYLVLFLGLILIRRIAAQAPPADDTGTSETAEASDDGSATASKTASPEASSTPAPESDASTSASAEPDEAPAGPVAAPTA